jgi:hypothetical protein
VRVLYLNLKGANEWKIVLKALVICMKKEMSKAWTFLNMCAYHIHMFFLRFKCELGFCMLKKYEIIVYGGRLVEQGFNRMFSFNCWERLGVCIVMLTWDRICRVLYRCMWVHRWVVRCEKKVRNECKVRFLNWIICNIWLK